MHPRFGVGSIITIITKYLGSKDTSNDDTGYRDTRVIIRGVLDQSPAHKQADRLRVGDWIRSVDGQQVYHSIKAPVCQ